MPRKTPVRELQKEEVVPTSPLRRSSRLLNSSPVPPKVVTRRNSASEAAPRTTTSTRSRRSSLSQETQSNEVQSDTKKTTLTLRTRRSSLTLNNEDALQDESLPKTKTRGSSVPKGQTVEVKTPVTRRRRSVTDEPEVESESTKKITRTRSNSQSKKNNDDAEVPTKKQTSPVEDIAASTPIKKVLFSAESTSEVLESIEEAGKETDSSDEEIVKKGKRRHTEINKIDFDLSVINEASLTEEEVSPRRRSQAREEAESKADEKKLKMKLQNVSNAQNEVPVEAKNIISDSDAASIQKPLAEEQKPNTSDTKKNSAFEELNSSVSDTSFNLQLSSSVVESNKNEVLDANNKENVCPRPSLQRSECEPMDVDDSILPSPIKSVDEQSPSTSAVTKSLDVKSPSTSVEINVNEVEQQLQVAEKATDEIAQVLSEEIHSTSTQENKQKDKQNTPDKEDNSVLEKETSYSAEGKVVTDIEETQQVAPEKNSEHPLHDSSEAKSSEPEIEKVHESPKRSSIGNLKKETDNVEPEKIVNSNGLKDVIIIETLPDEHASEEQRSSQKEHPKNPASGNQDINKSQNISELEVSQDVSKSDSINQSVIEEFPPEVESSKNNLTAAENKDDQLNATSDGVIERESEKIVSEMEIAVEDNNETVSLKTKENDVVTRSSFVEQPTSTSEKGEEKSNRKSLDQKQHNIFQQLTKNNISFEGEMSEREEFAVEEHVQTSSSEKGEGKNEENSYQDSSGEKHNELADKTVNVEAVFEKPGQIDHVKMKEVTLEKVADLEEDADNESVNTGKGTFGSSREGLEISGRTSNDDDFDLEVENINEARKQDAEQNVSINLCNSESDEEINVDSCEGEDSYRSPVKKPKAHSGDEFIDSKYYRTEKAKQLNVEDNESDSSVDVVQLSHHGMVVAETVEVASSFFEHNKDNQDADKFETESDVEIIENPSEDNADAKAGEKEAVLENSILRTSFTKRSQDKTSLVLQETLKAGDDAEKALSGRIHKVVDLFCSGIKNKSDVSINVSFEYTGQLSDAEDEHNKSDVVEISLTASSVQEADTEVRKGSKRRKICHENDDDFKSPSIRSGKIQVNDNIATSPNTSMSINEEKPVSAKKSKKRPSFRNDIADIREPMDESATKIARKMSVTFDEHKKSPGKTETRKSSSDGDRTPKGSPAESEKRKKLVHVTPFKLSNSQKEKDESSDDVDSSDGGNDESFALYTNLCASSFDNEENDITWTPDKELVGISSSDSSMDEANEELLPEEEPFSVENKNTSSSDDEVFVDSVVEKKTDSPRKKRKLFRLSRYSVSKALGSDETEENTENRPVTTKEKRSGVGHSVKESKLKSAKKSKLPCFSEFKNAKNLLPETSETKQVAINADKMRKRKHSPVKSDEEDIKHEKTEDSLLKKKMKKSTPRKISKKNKSMLPVYLKPSGGRRKNIKPVGMKPSTRISSGWEVSAFT